MTPHPHRPGRRSPFWVTAGLHPFTSLKGDPVNQLLERMGPLPYQYAVHSALNDYQVTIECPAGRAIITEIDYGENYVIETMFYGQDIRKLTPPAASPVAAITYLIRLTNTYLANHGMDIPPLVAPRRKAGRFAAAIACGALLIGLLAWGATRAFAGTGDDIAPRPHASFTTTPGGNR